MSSSPPDPQSGQQGWAAPLGTSLPRPQPPSLLLHQRSAPMATAGEDERAPSVWNAVLGALRWRRKIRSEGNIDEAEKDNRLRHLRDLGTLLPKKEQNNSSDTALGARDVLHSLDCMMGIPVVEAEEHVEVVPSSELLGILRTKLLQKRMIIASQGSFFSQGSFGDTSQPMRMQSSPPRTPGTSVPSTPASSMLSIPGTVPALDRQRSLLSNIDEVPTNRPGCNTPIQSSNSSKGTPNSRRRVSCVFLDAARYGSFAAGTDRSSAGVQRSLNLENAAVEAQIRTSIDIEDLSREGYAEDGHASASQGVSDQVHEASDKTLSIKTDFSSQEKVDQVQQATDTRKIKQRKSVKVVPVTNEDMLSAKRQKLIGSVKPSASYIREEELANVNEQLSWKAYISPDGNIARVLHILSFMAIVYNIFCVPIRWAYQLDSETTTWMVLDIVFDLVYAVDTALTAFLAFEEDGVLVTSRKRLYKRWLKKPFPLGLLSLLPLDYVFRTEPAWRFVRLIRGYRIPHLMQYFQRQLQVNASLFRINRILLYWSILLNCFSCGWWYVARTGEFPPTAEGEFNRGLIDSDPVAWRYVHGLYFAMINMCGIGEAVPETTNQYVFAIIVYFTGLFCYVVVIGIVSSVIHNYNTTGAFYRNKIQLIAGFMRERSLPNELRSRIMRYYLYMWKSRKGLTLSNLTDDLPECLLDDLGEVVTEDRLSKIAVFRGADPRFVKDLSLKLKLEHALPGTIIQQPGDVGRHMYIIYQGRVKLTKTYGDFIRHCHAASELSAKASSLLQESVSARDGNMSPSEIDIDACAQLSAQDMISLLSIKTGYIVEALDGCSFGEVSLVSADHRVGVVIAQTHCALLSLSCQDLEEVSSRYPQSLERLKARVASLTEEDHRWQQTRPPSNLTPRSQSSTPNPVHVAENVAAQESTSLQSSVPALVTPASSLARTIIKPTVDPGALPPPVREAGASGWGSAPPKVETGGDGGGPPAAGEFGSIVDTSNWEGEGNPNGVLPETTNELVDDVAVEIDEELLTKRQKYLLGFYIRPDSSGYKRWSLFAFTVVWYQCIIVPVRFAFEVETTTAWLVLDILADLVYIADAIVRSRTAYTDRAELLVRNSRTIKKHYVRKYLVIDALSLIPMDYVSYAFVGGPFVYYRFNRLLRAWRFPNLFAEWERIGAITPALLQALKLMFFILLVYHWVACLWFLVVREDDEALILFPSTSNTTSVFRGRPDILDLAVGAQYLRGLYWSTIALTGFGDAEPTTNRETVFSLVVALLGVSMYISLIGNVGSLVSNLDVNSNLVRQKIKNAVDLLRYRGIPSDVQEKVRNYYSYMWKSRRGVEEEEVFDDLPPFLRLELAYHLNHDLLEKVTLFQNVERSFINSVVMKLKAVVAPAKLDIVRRGDPGDCMYFITKGRVDILSPDGANVQAQLRAGEYFGEIALLFGGRRISTVRAGTYCDLYRLNKEDFEEVCRQFPETYEAIKQTAEKRFKLTTVLATLPLFKNADPLFLYEVNKKSVMKRAKAGRVVMKRGEVGREMYFISDGTVDVLQPDDKSVLCTLGDGHIIGEMSILFNKVRNATVRARDDCEFFVLRADDFQGVLQRFPTVADSVMKMAAERDKWTTVIQKVPLFRDVDNATFRKILSVLEPKILSADETVVRQGDVGSEMYFIASGTVRVVEESSSESQGYDERGPLISSTSEPPTGRVELATIGEGGFFGELGLLMNSPRNATVECVTEVELYVLTVSNMREIIGLDGQLGRKIVETAYDRYSDICGRMTFEEFKEGVAWKDLINSDASDSSDGAQEAIDELIGQ